ncbi:MAG: dihydroorotate dehydrogenase, partial [Bacillota bacterium]
GLIAEKLDQVKGVAGLEINISCPNVKKGGMAFGTYPHEAAKVVREVREKTKLPLIVKLSPNVTDIVEIAKSVAAVGADAISLINTLLAMAIDINKQKPIFNNIFAGLSGPAIKPIALRMVWQVSQAVKLPVIGMGGITSAADAIEFMLAGASAVSIGAGNFVNPCLALEVIAGIEAYCQEKGINQVQDLVGAAWKNN